MFPANGGLATASACCFGAQGPSEPLLTPMLSSGGGRRALSSITDRVVVSSGLFHQLSLSACFTSCSISAHFPPTSCCPWRLNAPEAVSTWSALSLEEFRYQSTIFSSAPWVLGPKFYSPPGEQLSAMRLGGFCDSSGPVGGVNDVLSSTTALGLLT